MGRQTTRREELVRVAEMTGVDSVAFENALDDGKARAALDADLALCRRLGVHGLPAYLVSDGKRATAFEGLVPYETLEQAVLAIKGGYPF